VAIINEYTGANERFSPRSVRVYPSVARTTADVRTVPWSVLTAPGRTAVAVVCS
jgi:hypothetical protein